MSRPRCPQAALLDRGSIWTQLARFLELDLPSATEISFLFALIEPPTDLRLTSAGTDVPSTVSAGGLAESWIVLGEIGSIPSA